MNAQLKRKTRTLLFCLVGSLPFAAQVHAYVPPAWFAVKSLSTSKSPYKTITIKSTVTNGSETLSLLTVIEDKSQKLETFILDSQGKAVSGVSRLFAEPMAFADSAAPIALLFENRFDFMVRGLRTSGVPIALPNDQDPANRELSQLARVQGKVAYFYGNENKVALYLEKDSFLPLQIKKANGFTIEFLNYRLVRFLSFPRKIRVQESGRLVIEEELKEIQIDAPVAGQAVEAQPITGGSDGLAKTLFQWLR